MQSEDSYVVGRVSSRVTPLHNDIEAGTRVHSEDGSQGGLQRGSRQLRIGARGQPRCRGTPERAWWSLNRREVGESCPMPGDESTGEAEAGGVGTHFQLR
jgi:hypothetical protein